MGGEQIEQNVEVEVDKYCDFEIMLWLAEAGQNEGDQETTAICGTIGTTLQDLRMDNFGDTPTRFAFYKGTATIKGVEKDSSLSDRLSCIALFFLLRFNVLKEFIIGSTELKEQEKVELFEHLCKMKKYLLLNPEFYGKCVFSK